MSLLKQVIKQQRQNDLVEDAAAGATSAGAVAGFRAHLGAASESRSKKKKKKKKLRRRTMPTGSVFAMRFEAAEHETFDSADVISKLKNAEQASEHEEDSTGFALEDEEGRIVKVYVAADQAQDFEKALGAALAGEDEDEEEVGSEENTSLEIAEVLFNLKDRYTIIDVEWPEIEEDEEEDVSVEGDDADTSGGDAEGDLDPDIEGGEGEGEEGGMEAELQGEEGDEFDLEGGEMGEDPAASALDKVIDLLKSQADAQKAEANAKEAEANAKEAEFNASAAESKVKQEEEVLDMEAYYDDQKTIDKEAKQLSKLAKWKHETAQEASNERKGESGKFKMPEGPEENNEQVFDPLVDKNRNHRLEPGEFIKYMFKNIQGGN